ncbi:hypothetical protein BIV25_33740 [Streptomyces sp. MUSC 14]|uniref:hypothetical protein n=1 Tax=Streptomyces sp. MUSC 14 TaxID=1354889 RepID=UPI0008F567BC|nr:hypothetical protein [Streptomyces sp. MUSC 14]OIJ89424.1 hypothetical protein BIV25_33740 [Streptomyces sp. MUSC 14]
MKDWKDKGWPTLGNRAGDRGPGHAAMEVWLSGGYGPHSQLIVRGQDSRSAPYYGLEKPSGQVLFSGTVPGLPRVTLVSSGGQLLRYATGNVSVKAVYSAPRPWDSSTLESPPLALNWNLDSGEPFPLAVPPWLANVRVEGISGKDATWRPLKVTDGLTAPIPDFKAAVGSSDLVDAQGHCGYGALIQADDTLAEGGRKTETFVYRPGWPYAVRLTYLAKAGQPYDASDAAPLDQEYIRRMAGALLCEGPGMNRSNPASEVIWRPLWRGTPAGGNEVAVFDQEVSYPSGQDYDANIRDGMIEVGVHKTAVFNTVVSNYDDSITPDTTARVGCLKSTTGIVVIGPATATTTRLADPATGGHWTAHGNVLQVPQGQLPGKSDALTVTATTPGKGGETDTGTCAWP